ncbi:MAG: cytochrome c [Chitinophagia bacterium]|nr:cytochrome c [Chitinophagia bacterium]
MHVNMKQLFFLAWPLFFATTTLSAQSGQEVYMNYCSACHGKKLEGGQAPSLLSGKWKQGETKKAIIQTIKKGVPNTAMMSWENMLTAKQIEEVTDYMLSLKKKNKPGADQNR